MRLMPKRKKETMADLSGLPSHDPGIDTSVDLAINWMTRAQDMSTSHDGGVARHYSLKSGWSSSYPETTGYIIPTMLKYDSLKNNENIKLRTKKMLDWLVSIQLPGGGFQGGTIVDHRPVMPVTFNTGQILIGLASGVQEFGDIYRDAMSKAADWLINTQDSDGCFRKNLTPFAIAGEKAYETHVAWGLFEAARIEPSRGYEEAAMANIKWALTKQTKNGWFHDCCLTDPLQPLTHTIGYVFRGVLEAYLFSNEPDFLKSCKKLADGLITTISPEGFLPGRINQDWQGTVKWSCLTGAAQNAYCLLTLYLLTQKTEYKEWALKLNAYLRKTMKTEGPADMKGGIKGSFPVNGGYGQYEYLNWACKFFIDSNLLEKEVQMKEKNA